MISSYLILGTATTGGAGASTSTATSGYVISGRVVSVGVVYRGTAAAATTDVIVRTANKNGALPDVTLLTLTDGTATVWRQPYVLKNNAALGTTIAGQYVEPVIHDQVEVVVQEGDDGQIVDVTLLVEH